MSLSWSERLHVFLGPGFACGWAGRPWGAARRSWRFESGIPGGPEGALEALRALLAATPAHTRTSVIVSNHFVRYLLLAWQPVLARASEQHAFAQHLFAETLAGAAGAWEVRVAPEAAGRARLASAIDRAWLEALREAAGSAGARLVSLQPYFMYAFNEARHRESLDDCWFAVPEPGRVCLGLIGAGAWRSMANTRLREGAGEGLARVLRLEQARAAAEGLAANSLVAYGPDGDLRQVSAEGEMAIRRVTDANLSAALCATPAGERAS